MSASNPFTNLNSPTTSGKEESAKTKTKARERLELSYCIERIFLVTLDKDLEGYGTKRPSSAIFLDELYKSLDDQEWLDLENMSQAMFERTMMSASQLKQNIIKVNTNTPNDSQMLEARTFIYLSQCYVRACKERRLVDAAKCKEVILENASTCLRQPDFYQGQNIDEQLTHLIFTEYFSAESEHLLKFVEDTFTKVVKAENLLTLCSILHPVLTRLHGACTRGLLGKMCADSHSSNALKIIHFFTRNENLAEVLLAYTNTNNYKSALAYEKSLFGTILSSSCAPNSYVDDSSGDLFANPVRMGQSDVDRAENIAFTNSAMITSCMHDLFLRLCKLSSRTKHLLLTWIGKLLAANTGRVKLASTMAMSGSVPRDECSDGLMLNLCSVLVRLCVPFSQPHSPKLMRIQPQYCRQQFDELNEQEKRHHHASGLPDETFLISMEEDDVQRMAMPSEYGFICELFFLTQQSLYLGLHGANEKFINLNRELNRIQSFYQQVQSNPGVPNAQAIKHAFESAMKKYLAIKTALTDPELLKPVLKFHVASATYLSYIATGGDNSTPFTPLSFPLPAGNTELLGCMPEFLITNITDAMSITRRFKSSYLQESFDFAGHLMDLILVFMGSKDRLKNPHLRAKLAEVLHEMVPKQDSRAAGMVQVQEMLKERLFTDHPNVAHLAEVLFNVFVSIEATGESVQFEQKLNYRQPMYKVIDFIWKIDLHKQAVVRLSDEALKDIENTDAPLFLKFVNLLVNDANFLLDEALDYMKQIKEKEEERQNSATELAGRELQQFEANLSQMAMLARFHNTAAIDTTHTLALLTSQCSQLFCHSIMVERISAMLNYFLLKLTGPQMNEFKVKEFDKYEFKPAVVVSEICEIYLNLSHSDTFCQAVSADGRSYSTKLFPQAANVLTRIHQPADKIQSFIDLSAKIKSAAVQQLEDDDLFASAPEEFLDPIMGTLMKDPVLLPSSKQVVDKATIARHILSDQNDPFNRSPLSLDQVIPDVELKSKILSWIQERKKHKSS